MRLSDPAQAAASEAAATVAAAQELSDSRFLRRALLVAKVVGGTVAVAALLGTLQLGLLPYPSSAPAVPVSPEPSGATRWRTAAPTRPS